MNVCFVLLAASFCLNVICAVFIASARRRVRDNSGRSLGGQYSNRNFCAQSNSNPVISETDATDVDAPKLSRDTIFSALQSGIIATDESGKVLLVNPSAEQMLGLEYGTLFGRSIADCIGTRLLFNLVREVFQKNEAGEAEMIITGPEERTLEAVATKFIDSEVGPGVIIMLNDVTQLRQLETLRRDFVANVSHELKTPVASIQGFTETLLDGAIDDHSVRTHFLEIILHQGKRLRTIIDDLLKLARLESPGQNLQLNKQVTRAADLLETVRTLTIERARNKGVKLAVNCSYDLMLSINMSLIEQSLLNLVDNAIKYCPEGSQITVSSRATDRGAELIVSDTGAGISAEHLPRLFERFYRVDKARSRDEGGSGLGLAIVKHIALAHGGNVSVESSPGFGSIFTIHLPSDSVVSGNALAKKAV